MHHHHVKPIIYVLHFYLIYDSGSALQSKPGVLYPCLHQLLLLIAPQPETLLLLSLALAPLCLVVSLVIDYLFSNWVTITIIFFAGL